MLPRYRPERRYLEEPDQNRHRGVADGQPEDRHADRERGGDERAERQEQDGGRGEEADQLADAGAGIGEARNRSPPISMRSGSSPRSRSTAATSASRSLADSSLCCGYCTRISAIRPSAETRPARTAASPPASGAWTGSPGAEHVRELPHLGLQPGQRRPRGTLVEVAHAAVERGDDHLGRHAVLAGAGLLDQLRGQLRVQRGSGHRVGGPPTERTRGDDGEHDDGQPGRDHPPRMAGRAAAQTGEGFRKHRGVLQ
jgi:hypothetical protein